ncbi:NADH(P)-binding-domain-containing protein [Flagelloscypha sp. PMI_526]|nr:NADH(P)-binding-domain-containing protein [Flagelloscypha sp. PMI_526]
MGKNIVIVGGHGGVRMPFSEIEAASAKPLVLSIEHSSVEDFAKVFEGADVVVWSAGAGGKPGPDGQAAAERTKAIDQEGAIKVFDALEKTSTKPRLVLVSAIDDENDKEISQKYGKVLETYIKAKYIADKNLTKRTAFKWTILRPGGLTNEPGTGKASVGKTHLSPTISRDDVAKALAVLVDREDIAGFAIDIIGGETSIEEGIEAFVKNGKTDFPEDY